MGVSHRAYALLHVKSVDVDRRLISGIATSPTPDRVGDVVEPLGVQFKNPLPLLLHHDSRKPVGIAKFKKPTADGIEFEASLPLIDEPGTLKERVDEAWQSIKAGLIAGVSIGFRSLEEAFSKDTGGFRFLKTEVLELSLVTVPANADATIHTIKSLDVDRPAVSGTGRPVVHTSRAADACPGAITRRSDRAMPTTIADQIKTFEATRETKQARMNELMTKAGDAGVTLDEPQSEEYDTLENQVQAINAHLDRLAKLAETQKAMAKPIAGADPAAGSASRGHSVITVKDNLPPGIGMARAAIAKVLSYIDHVPAREIVAERWPDDARLKQFFNKAAVPAAITTNAAYAGNLVYADNLASEFVEFLRPQTLVGRLPLRRVPFNIRFASQTTGAVAGWVGEGRAKPVTSAATGTGSLAYTKIAAIAVISQEMARFSSPSAEMWMRDELAAAVVERLDIDFIDPAQAAVANVNPASITNGLTALSSAGPTADNIRTDLQNLLEQFIINNMGAAGVVLIMPETLALAASLLTNAFGQPEFPTLGPTGGTLRGIPVFTTQYAANQSGSGNLVIALKPSEIALADDGQVDISVSTEASVEMSDAPTNRSDTPTAASLVSLWQTNSIGIKAERFVNWVKKRSTAVVYMDDVNWGSIGSPS